MSQNPIDLHGAKILIVDDVPANIEVLRQALASKGYEIFFANSGERALKVAANASPELVLLDIIMPGMDGFETCRRLKEDKSTKDIPVIFITAKREMEDVIGGFRVGGVDYITKPFEKEEVLTRVETHLKAGLLMKALAQKNDELTIANQKLQQEITRREQAEKAQKQAEDNLKTNAERLSLISEQEAQRWGIASFIGKSKTIGKIMADIRRLHHAGTTNVLITGESGTGKELIARAIHFGGPRAAGAFIPVNCSAIPSDLAESRFLGHVKGAFTGANTDRKGYFELADGGTLFLDEIGDMSPDMQSKLLRVIEDGCVMPLGARREKQVDVRILAATNADLQAKMSEGVFRTDLYYRLAVFTVPVPPLRERKEDIPLLAEHFLNLFATEMGIPTPVLSQEALTALTSYSFPGNVRELKNIIERALIESGGATVEPGHLHFMQTTTASPLSPFRLQRNSEFPTQIPLTSDSIDEAHASESHSLDIEEYYRRMSEGGESFWDVVQEQYMVRELNRPQVKAIIARGLQESRGNYKRLLPLLGLPESDYQKFMDFLRYHELKPDVVMKVAGSN